MPRPDPVSASKASRLRRDASGPPLSPYTSTLVQDRILQWQAQGTAAVPPAALSVQSVPRTESRYSPPPSPPRSPKSPAKKTARATRGRKTQRLAEEEQEEWIRRGRASTPKKRVVSDEHWMKTRHKSASQDRPPGSTMLSHDDSPQPRGVDGEPGPARTEREERRRRRVAARTKAAAEKAPFDDMQSNVGNRTGYNSERDELSEGSVNWGSLPDRDDQSMLINSRYAATLGQVATPELPPRTSLRVKGPMLSKTKAMLGIHETGRNPSDLVTSIDAWLEEQPDRLAEDAPTTHQPKSHHARTGEKGRRKRSPRRKASTDVDNPIRLRDVLPERPAVAATALPAERTAPPAQNPTSNDLPPAPTQYDWQEDQDQLLLPAPLSIPQAGCTLKRRLTTHEDLISELSRPGRPRRPHRRRTVVVQPAQGQHEKEAIERILSAAKEDNTRYARELRTLVDGVIPVLLQCVLSKNDAVATAVLFSMSSDPTDDHNITKPIVDMGVALERLKSLHNRMSCDTVDRYLSWCQTAHRAYSDYLLAWKLGFQDIILNLAPLENETDHGDLMARDPNGDIVDADGEKADVAYLLKRPLIKIRKVSKILVGLAALLKDHAVAQKISEDYIELTSQAKRKHQQEQGRLEDQVAAHVDVTKTRDIRSLGTLPGVVVEKGLKVRARDTFNMTLQHSSGQRIDCKIELILRDRVDGRSAGGDVLICQVETNGKWLLFAPVTLADISARRDDSEYDLVIMVRGHTGLRSQWHELLALQAEDQDAVTDWMNMLGSNPLPPRLNLKSAAVVIEPPVDEARPLTSAALAQFSSIDDIDIPLGEPSVVGGGRPDSPEMQKPPPQMLSLGGGLQPKPIPPRWLQLQPTAYAPQQSASKLSAPYKISHPLKKTRVQSEVVLQPSPPSAVAQQRLHSLQSSGVGATVLSDSSSSLTGSTNYQSTSSATSVATSQPSVRKAKHVSLVLPEVVPPAGRHDHRRSVSTVIAKGKLGGTKDVDASSPRKPFSSTSLTESLRGKWATMSGWGRKPAAPTAADTWKKVFEPPSESSFKTPTELSFNVPTPPAHKVRPHPPALTNPLQGEMPSPPQTVMVEDPAPEAIQHSSPRRVEYAASTASETPDEYDSDTSEESSYSDTSEDLGSELKDDLMSLPDMKRKRPVSRPPPLWRSAPSTSGTQTIAPSDSASQGPYRSVPASSSYAQTNKDWCKALICAWSDQGSWEPLRDEECAILVSPGLIEAFSLAYMQRHPDEGNSAPLVAFELTPIVPLRKGTALDITIRSPPTANSQIKTTNNVMFRSRSLPDCEKLYHMINWARCNNPTYMELERARPRPQPTVTFAAQQPERPRSWFSFGGPQRKNSYRAGSTPPSVGESAAMVGSVSHTISALKRFSKSSAFSINRSSVIRRPGRATTQSLFSADTNAGGYGSGGDITAPPTQLGVLPGKDGPNVPETSAAAVAGGGMVNNMKIKLFLRQGQDWKPLGTCRLSVLPAPATNTPDASRPGSAGGGGDLSSEAEAARRHGSLPNTPRREYRLPSSSHTPHRVHGDGREKRILITQKDRADIVLLDEILGESCFEKVAERGIAVKVWTEDETMKIQGGVMTGRGRMYMIQFGVQSEASWVFGLCGTYRYGMSNET